VEVATDEMGDSRTLSVGEVATLTGFARQTIYRAIKDGRMNRWLIRDDKGQARLLPDAVAAIRCGVIRPRVDSKPRPAPTPAPEPAPEQQAGDPAELWADTASWANALLDFAEWGPPQWPADQWATLDAVLDQADDLAAEHGSYSPELLASLQADGEL
jgi:excisionase family DNA binding protein